MLDKAYRIVLEKCTVLPETTDEDGFPCEDLNALSNWVRETWSSLINQRYLDIQAANVAAYGASVVLTDASGTPVFPLYNYLKPFPEGWQTQLLERYGGAEKIACETASPLLGNLNAGMQLYRLKRQYPEQFARVHRVLHLPQYVASLLHGHFYSDHTGIGCHTMLWDFQKNDYHRWVREEGFLPLFPPIARSDAHARTGDEKIAVGTGLHDSSAALLPYLCVFQEPFVLLSTGTWCIALNPFNIEPLTLEALTQDCLCYIAPHGQPVKAARYFGGHEHGQEVKRIAARHGVASDFYSTTSLQPRHPAEADYLTFMRTLIAKQAASLRLVLPSEEPPRYLFVDGGFSKNRVYMQLLAQTFPEMIVCAAEAGQATALGAALALHTAWNPLPIPRDMIEVRRF